MTVRIAIAALIVGGIFGTAAVAATPSYIEKAVADSARPATDTARDTSRKPADLLAFAGIKQGMTVVDLLPGAGYFTRIFAKAVGPQGKVTAYFGLQYDERLKNRSVDPDNQFADLKAFYPNLAVKHTALVDFKLPAQADVVWTSDNYHDLHNKQYGPVDVAKLNNAIFAALKPGGVYIVVDHRAAKGAGAGVSESLHRMDEDIAKTEIEAAGFKLVEESKILSNPSDDVSKRVFEEGEHDHTDQMVLKFQKPRG